MEKTRIISHTFKGSNEHGYTYEITFKSLEDTVRMDSMCKGLNRYDRMRPFWSFIHNLICHPLLITRTKWADNFHDWTARRM
jgi:hypothetical protein